jgi:hypothetical protein
MRRSLLALTFLCACAQPRVNAPAPQVDVPLDRQVGVSANGVVIHNSATDGGQASVVNAPLKLVWPALKAAYDDLAIPTVVLDTVGHQIGNGQFQFRRQLGGQPASRYFDCGSSLTGPRADEGLVRAVIVTRLTESPDGTTLMSTAVHGSVQSSSGTTSARMDCASTGRLESRLQTAIAARTGT